MFNFQSIDFRGGFVKCGEGGSVSGGVDSSGEIIVVIAVAIASLRIPTYLSIQIHQVNAKSSDWNGCWCFARVLGWLFS